ncbi:MAG: RtcB family protein [Nanoarchaeota archaeon]|nr:RtcB family protein [Nanoarchaeota archaeon]
MEVKKISEYIYEIPKKGEMNVPVRFFLSEKLFNDTDDGTLGQLVNVSKLPGVLKYPIGMSDMHLGYGFPIGGVAAFDLKKGVISPGATGFDINCGVRVVITNIKKDEFHPKREKILHDLKRTIPSGVGRGGERYSKETIKEVLTKGSYWALENKMATKEDIERTEENGRMQGANPADVSERAISRGLSQLGTLGAGNHFIDIQVIEEIYNEKIAELFGLKKDYICFMIHCGSRGLGHQIASDYIQLIEKEYGSHNFPDRELGYALITSELGKKYFSAMKCAVNFAFCNRQVIMHKISKLLEQHFPKIKTSLLYDVAHNISKIEEHQIDGKRKKVLIIRKGATRSFGPGNPEIPKIYQKTGQPVIIPGSMSTPSFILAGTKKAEEISFGSTAHGAGRSQSRAWAHKTLKPEQIKKILKDKGVVLEGSFKGTIEESELSYKDIEEVIKVSHNLKISEKIAKLKPIAVMIG